MREFAEACSTPSIFPQPSSSPRPDSRRMAAPGSSTPAALPTALIAGTGIGSPSENTVAARSCTFCGPVRAATYFSSEILSRNTASSVSLAGVFPEALHRSTAVTASSAASDSPARIGLQRIACSPGLPPAASSTRPTSVRSFSPRPSSANPTARASACHCFSRSRSCIGGSGTISKEVARSPPFPSGKLNW